MDYLKKHQQTEDVCIVVSILEQFLADNPPIWTFLKVGELS